MTSILLATCVAKHNWRRGLWEFGATTMIWRSGVVQAQKRGLLEGNADCFLKSESSCRTGISFTCVAPWVQSNTIKQGSRKADVGKR